MNYLDYFGLKEDPFKITPDYTYFFPALTHRVAENLLHYVVTNGEGFCVIIGEPGTGKTTILRKFLSKLPENYIYALILSPTLNPDEFLKTLLDEFGVEYDKDISKNEIFKIFKKFLEEKVKEGKKVLIIIDEAQNLPIETLEELRLLSNLETEKEKLIQIMLFGQPELEEKLNDIRLRQLNQRIPNKVFLQPLSEREVKNYIYHRLKVAGNEDIQFEPDTIKKIYELTHGYPRLVNILVSRSLMVAFMEDSKVIKPQHIESVYDTINFKKSEDRDIMAIIYCSLLFLAIIFIAFYLAVKFGFINI
ncbi:MAG: AAA family ATPase [Hydrogenothermaceae bacterium]|nr:AAA family ATPase [Hydrogenothermaceae bacterium]